MASTFSTSSLRTSSTKCSTTSRAGPALSGGRADLMAQFAGYGDNIKLQAADRLITHKTDDGRVVVIEYEAHGTILATGVKYNNRFASIIRIESRKILHWRDYMDSLAAWNALTAGVR